MKRFSLIAVVASLAINAGRSVVIASGIEESSLPQGQVIVTELSSQTELAAYAQASVRDAQRRLAL